MLIQHDVKRRYRGRAAPSYFFICYWIVIGIVTESLFCGKPDGLSFNRMRLAKPSYDALMFICEVNVPSPGCVQSPCACPCDVPIKLSFASRTWIGKTASLNHWFGAIPATVNECETVASRAGVVTTTCVSSGALDVEEDVA